MSPVIALLLLGLGFVLLEAGADRLTDAIAALARRLHASEHVVGLLTAGGEWEELIVVVLAIGSGHAGLAIGNVVGSCLANLIGSMPLGFFGPRAVVPDRSARAYALVLVVVTVIAAGFLVDAHVSPAEGGVLVLTFTLYVVSILLVIQRGWFGPFALDDDVDDEVDGATESSLVRPMGVLLIGLVVIA